MEFHKILHCGQKASKKNWVLIRKICRFILRARYQSEIDLAADIDKTVYFCHQGFGIVINPRVKIGGGTCIQHCVTIGDMCEGGPVPIIGKNVFVGARAIILGDVHVGDNVKIGAGAVVINNIPDNCTVVGVPAKIVKS